MATLYHGVASVEDTGDQAMTTLYQQWYNAVVSGLRLDPGTFQLLQPNTPLGATSDQLWAYFNAIPAHSLVSNFQLNGLNRLYDDYRAVVNMLISQTGDAFRADLGDSYQAWIGYVSGLSPIPKPSDLPGIFFSWATVHAPGVASRGRNDLDAILDDPIALAQQTVVNQAGFINGTPNFGATIADLRDAIIQAPSGSFAFNSSTQSSDTSGTWAKAAAGGIWDFFSADGSGEWSKTQSKAASSQLVISLSFDHVLTFPAAPGSWYNSAALTAAFATRDNTMWRPGTPNWNTTFGPTGNLQRFLTGLIVVDGINMSMTSSAEYDTSEQEEIRTHAEAGFFPFFSAETSGGYTSSLSFNSGGTMTVTAASPAGNPVVLGAVVSPAGALLGSSRGGPSRSTGARR
jgi:hypothetical protein